VTDQAAADLVRAIADRLIAHNQTLAIAESSTGGLIGHWLTNQPGASQWFIGGVVAYHNRLKTGLLAVPAAHFAPSAAANTGTVSAATARAMALGARQRLGTDWAVAETGLAGTHPGRSRKPVGLSHVAIAGPALPSEQQPHLWEQQYQFTGDRSANKAAAAHAALRLLRRALEATSPVDTG
jgi:PncC family amidohydrolase